LSKGDLDWRNKGFIGVRTNEQELYRDELEAIRAEVRDQYIEMPTEESELAAA